MGEQCRPLGTWILGNIGNVFEMVQSPKLYCRWSNLLQPILRFVNVQSNSFIQATFYTIKTKQAIGLRAHCYARETGRAEAVAWSPPV